MAARTKRRYPIGAVNMGKRVQSLKNWRDGYNPKRNLDIDDAIRLCENYSLGRFSELMWVFGAPFMGIESTDAIYLTIIKRRRAALDKMENDVRIGKTDAKNQKAIEQKACLDEAYGRIDNLKEAILHLQMANFRGFAHCTITPNELKPVHQWNMSRDGSTGPWRYNPDARDVSFESLGSDMDMDPADYLILEDELPVGRLALMKDLKSGLSDKDWDAFIEIYGIPAWMITGPANLPQDKEQAFQEAAEKVAAGGSGYLPNGSTATAADSPRGMNPFESRLRYLNEMLVLAGTGGLLTMLSMSGSGTLAGSAHMEAFKMLAAGDAGAITGCFQKRFDRRILMENDLLLPGERPMAFFMLDSKQEADVGKSVQQIRDLASAGYITKPEQVTEITGYEVTYVAPAVRLPEFPGATPLMNSNRLLPPGDEPHGDLAAAIAQDFGSIGSRLDELLAEEDGNLQAVAKRLLAELPELAKKAMQNPAAAALIEKAMRKAAGLEEGTP